MTKCLTRKSQQDSTARFVMVKRGPERAIETRQYDLLRSRVVQKESPRLGRTLLSPRIDQKEPPRLGNTICYGQDWARKSHQDSTVRFLVAKNLARKSHQEAVRFVTAKRGSERAFEFRQYDLLQPNVGQKEPPRFGSTICYGQIWVRKRQYDLLRPRVGQKKSPRFGNTICYGQDLVRKKPRTISYGHELARKSPRDSGS